MNRIKNWFPVLLLCGVFAFDLDAAEINATVHSATDKYAAVVTDSELIPTPGDKVEIFFKVPGADEEISVAAGHVLDVTGSYIAVQIDDATGNVSKDQLVRITSNNPQKRPASSAASESPSGASPSTAVANSTAPPAVPLVSSGPPASAAVPPSPAKTLPPSIPFPTVGPNAKPAAAAPQEIDSAVAEFVNKGIAQYSAGDINGAIDSYTSGVRIAPNLAVLYLNRANAYLFKPDFKAAMTDANKAIELKVEKLDDAYVIRGAANAGQRSYGAAIADCNRALKINPNHALAYNNRANNKIRLRDLDSALSDCNKSIALDPNSPLPYYNRGYVYMNKGNAPKAIADWNRAMQMQPAFRGELEPLIQHLQKQTSNRKK